MRLLYFNVCVLFLMSSSALVVSAHANHNKEKCQSSSNNIAKLPFPQVLAKAGKTIFRPGGTVATQRLRSWAALVDKKKPPTNKPLTREEEEKESSPNKSCRVLEMAAGIGGLDLASTCHVLLVDPDQQKLQRVQNTAQRKGLEIRTRRVDLTTGDSLCDDQETFDAVIFEGSLTTYSDSVKRRIFKELRNKSPQILLHELGIRDSVTAEKAITVRVKVGEALGLADFAPLTVSGWKALLQDCGYQVTHQETGPLRILSPQTMIQDEGPRGAAQIAYNLATQRDLRERVLSTKAVLTSHSDSLSYILVRAVRKE